MPQEISMTFFDLYRHFHKVVGLLFQISLGSRTGLINDLSLPAGGLRI
jgi:hypothetical protein